MRYSLVMLGLALALLTGCGTESTTTIIERSPAPPKEPQREPHGSLTARGIGPVTQGMSTEEVRSRFGAPQETASFAGCELGADPSPGLSWSWRLEGGELHLSFDGASAELVSYRIDSPALSTALGDRVGDTFSSLEANWGGGLEALDLGVASTAENGYWYVGDPTRAELLFDVRNGQIDSISGGYLPPCE